MSTRGGTKRDLWRAIEDKDRRIAELLKLIRCPACNSDSTHRQCARCGHAWDDGAAS